MIAVLAIALVGAVALPKLITPSPTPTAIPTTPPDVPTSFLLKPDSQTRGIGATASFTIEISDISPIQVIIFHTGTYSNGQENVYNLIPSKLTSSHINANTIEYQFVDTFNYYQSAGYGYYQGYCTITDANGNSYNSNTVAVAVQ